MKIEIGESLIYSWLRHKKHCQLVQTNWKPSSEWNKFDIDWAEKAYCDAQKYFHERFQFDLFKKNSGVEQALQQAELDVIGVQIEGPVVQNIYAVDVAFHEKGLNYGSKEETATKVLKKMIRSALCLVVYFRAKKGEILFVTPKAHGTFVSEAKGYIESLEIFFKENVGCDFQFEILFDSEFYDKITQPVFDISERQSDTSELFLRAVQLLNLSEKKPRLSRQKSPTTKSLDRDGSENSEGLETERIGAFIENIFAQLERTEGISEREIQNLLNIDYSRKVFGTPSRKHSLLVSEDSALRNPNFEKIRYWKKTYRFNGKGYKIYSQWAKSDYQFYKNRFEAWLKMLETNDVAKAIGEK